MREYDNEILKANIRKLRDDSGLNQDDFAAIAGISQSRLSKLLGNDKGNRFSVDQVYKIATHFNVSVDYLITGKEPEPITSTRQACEVLVHLFENYNVSTISHTQEEEYQMPLYDPVHQVPETEVIKKDVKYNAIFFADYWYPNPDRDYTDDELDTLRDDAYFNGNDYGSAIEINKFLDAFVPIFKLHDAGKMPDEAYRYTIQSLLDSVK